jgi:hypothetical protein
MNATRAAMVGGVVALGISLAVAGVAFASGHWGIGVTALVATLVLVLLLSVATTLYRRARRLLSIID